MSFTVPFFCASVAIVRRITWKVSLGNSSSSANPSDTIYPFIPQFLRGEQVGLHPFYARFLRI